jgi:uncharacterized membrane protein
MENPLNYLKGNNYHKFMFALNFILMTTFLSIFILLGWNQQNMTLIFVGGIGSLVSLITTISSLNGWKNQQFTQDENLMLENQLKKMEIIEKRLKLLENKK